MTLTLTHARLMADISSHWQRAINLSQVPDLFPHQLEGVDALLRILEIHSGALLGDVMGLGKTLQSLLCALAHVAREGARVRAVEAAADADANADASASGPASDFDPAELDAALAIDLEAPLLFVVPRSALDMWGLLLRQVFPDVGFGSRKRTRPGPGTSLHGAVVECPGELDFPLSPRVKAVVTTPGLFKRVAGITSARRLTLSTSALLITRVWRLVQRV